MAKVEYINKARKEYKCSKCGEIIKVGEPYRKLVFFRRRPIVRCAKCGFKNWETRASEYGRSVGQIVEDWRDIYEMHEDTAENIASDLEDIKSDCEDRLDNIPEQLRDADAGTLLQERIDNLYLHRFPHSPPYLRYSHLHSNYTKS